MCNSFCPRARGEKGDWRSRNSSLSIFRDIMTSIASRTIDLQLAMISTLISGLVVVFTLVVVLVLMFCVAPHAAEVVLGRSMPLQELPRSRWYSAAFLLFLHVLVIHHINGRRMRAYGIAANRAATGRAKCCAN